MKGFEGFNLREEGRPEEHREAAHPRAVGAPLPIGGSGRAGLGEPKHPAPPPPGRGIVNSPTDSSQSDQPSNAQRAMNVLKMAMPLVQRILPLLDGNIGTALSNMLSTQLHKPAPPVNVNLTPIEDGLAELRSQQRDLRDQVVEQNTSLKRVEDHLEMVREATDRNTLEQQELLEDLKAVGTKVNLVAIIALGMLAVSVLLNLFLYLHIQRVLP